MLLCVCDDDNHATHEIGRNQSTRNQEVFGECYPIFGREPIPRLREDEDLFVIAHRASQRAGNGRSPVIGDETGDHSWSGDTFFEKIEHLFPARYHGRVYFAVCYSATAPRSWLSFVEVFKSQVQAVRRRAMRFYGHTGAIAGDIPLPGTRNWIEV